MSKRQDDAGDSRRSTLPALEIYKIYVNHAEAWSGIFEGFWLVSKNPAFAWMALELLLDPCRTPSQMPEWLRSYLWQSASNLNKVIWASDMKKVADLIPMALSLEKGGGRVIQDAQKLWQSPSVYGLYEYFKETAPDGRSDKAQWAAERIHQQFELASVASAHDLIREAKRTVQAVIRVRGGDPTDALVSRVCMETLAVQEQFGGAFDSSDATSKSHKAFREFFTVPPPRRAAIRAALQMPA